MERVETIDFGGLLTLGLKFVQIARDCSREDIRRQCDLSNHDPRIFGQRKTVEDLRQKLIKIRDQKVPHKVKKTLKAGKDFTVQGTRCLKWEDKYDRRFGKYGGVGSDGLEKLVCVEQRLVDGKIDCVRQEGLERITFCEQEQVKDKKVSCKVQKKVWPKYIAVGQLIDSKKKRHPRWRVVQRVNVACLRYGF